MQSQQKLNGLLVMLCLFFINTTFAQLYLPPVDGPNSSGNIILGAHTPADHGDPNEARINYRLDVNGGNVTDGSQSAIYAKTLASGHNAGGEAYGALGTAANWFAAGSFSGATGVAKNITLLRTNYDDKTASAIGGNFVVKIDDPIALPNVGSYYVTGVSGTLDGNITTYPQRGVVSAISGNDRIKGTNTWAGYFDGRGYFSDNVGINNKNTLSDLSINGDGDARHVVSVTTPTHRGNGTAGIVSLLPQITSASDWSRSIIGKIEAGAGSAVGVQGSAYTATPSDAGRTYGVYAQAGNATSGYNYALFSELLGQNDGAAVLGWDSVNFPTWNRNTTGSWAGKFIGNSHFSNKVAIGTTSMPAMTTVNGEDYLLYVLGGGRFTEVIVTPAWADYVFEENYKLLDLETVENHIKEKGYLHNTPSGAEIEENGMEVGQMMANQQEKIEELFLHLIDMNKTLKALKAENENLKTELTALKK